MNASQKCVDLIEQFEGFRSQPYTCPAGKATIGFGSTHYADGTPVTLQDAPITKDDAEVLILELLNREFAPAVSRMVTVPLTQNQFDALCSFAFNLGSHTLEQSTLLKLLNAGDYAHAAAQFSAWVHCQGKVLDGLVARREAERVLFCTL